MFGRKIPEDDWEQHEIKIKRLLVAHNKEVIRVAKRMYNSEGIDLRHGRYGPEYWALSKLLLTAALDDCKNMWEITCTQMRDDMKNIRRF